MNNFKKPFTYSFSDSYNPGWRNHPNFSWRNDNNAHQMPSQGTTNPPLYASSRPRNLKETMQAFIQGQTNINNQTSQAIIVRSRTHFLPWMNVCFVSSRFLKRDDAYGGGFVIPWDDIVRALLSFLQLKFEWFLHLGLYETEKEYVNDF